MKNIIAARAKTPPTLPPIIAPNFEGEAWLLLALEPPPPSAPAEEVLVGVWANVEVAVKVTTLPSAAVDVDVRVLV